MAPWVRMVALGVTILAAAYTVVPGQPLAQTAGVNVAGPATLTDALNAVTTKYSIGQAWFYLRKDDGVTASYTRGDTQGPSQKLWIGSLSKSVTAIGVAVLIQDGRLTLHTRLGDSAAALPPGERAPARPVAGPGRHRAAPGTSRGLAGQCHQRSRRTDSVRGRCWQKLPSDTRTSRTTCSCPAPTPRTARAATGTRTCRTCSWAWSSRLSPGKATRRSARSRILAPLGISARVAPALQRVAPFAGWEMSEPDLLRLWTVFDVNHPSLLTRTDT